MPKSPSMPETRLTCARGVFFGPATCSARGMLRWHNIVRCLLATVMIATSTSAGGVVAQDAPVAPEQLSSAFNTIRQWVNKFETPKMTDASSRVELSGATGVCVILRRAGRVMGVGADADSDDLMVRRAVGKAMNEVLADPALSSLTARLRQEHGDTANAAIALETIHADLGRSLAIELEVAGKLIPLLGRSIDQMARRIEPGLDGVGLRHNQTLELAFPAHMRALNTGGESAKLLLSIAMKTGISLKEISDLPNRDDVALYSFRTQTLWQASSEQPPQPMVRGDLLVPQESVNQQSITRFADDLAQHLMNSMWPDPPPPPRDPQAIGPEPAAAIPAREPLGLMGDYSPVSDQYRPLLAPPMNQALVAFALKRYVLTHPDGSESVVARRALLAASSLLRDLANITPAEDNPRDDLAACAAVIFAVCEEPAVRNDSAVEELFVDAVNRINNSFDPASGFVDRPAGGLSRGVSPHAQAMIAGAMCRLLNTNSPPVAIDPHRVRAAIDAAWQSVPDPQHIALLPWIGWAEHDYAQALRQPISNTSKLKLMIDALNQVCVKAPKDANDVALEQLAGGFALMTEAAGLGEASAQATAQTSRPTAWLACALRNPKLVPPEQANAAWQAHLTTIRFLMQLSVRPELAGFHRAPHRAAGGIRAALWDSDQPVAAQALTLIAASETLRILAEQP